MPFTLTLSPTNPITSEGELVTLPEVVAVRGLVAPVAVPLVSSEEEVATPVNSAINACIAVAIPLLTAKLLIPPGLFS